MEEANTNKIFLGIDPGKNGAITSLLGDKVESIVTPTIGKEYDILSLRNILKMFENKDVYCVLEDVHALFGSSASGTFSFGFGLGLLEGILVAFKIPYTKVAPKKWQRQMFEGISLMTKPSKTGKTQQVDTKAMALIAAQRIFPYADLKESPRCKKAHDGIVDSLLMAQYCRLNFK